MKPIRSWIACVLFLLHTYAGAQIIQTDHVRAELLSCAAGDGKLWLGLRLQHMPHVHPYGKNPGESGEPTHLQWILPEGASASSIGWPSPQRLTFGPLLNCGCEGDLLLAVPVDISRVRTPAVDIRL